MRLAALFSGGKDSTYAIFLAKKLGHEIKYLATIISENPDSYMFHTSNIGLTILHSKVMGIPLVSKESKGLKEKELDDLKELLKDLSIDGVVCGAIASKYQKERVEKICNDLKLKLITPLWGRDSEHLLKEMIKDGFEIIITQVAAEGFEESWIGRKIDEDCIKDLIKLKEKYRINISAEGGEYESLVLNCPLFLKKIQITDSKKIWNKDSGYLEIKDAKMINKN